MAYRATIALSVILTIFVVVCLIFNKDSIWFDEAFSVFISKFNMADIWHYTSADVHPPLYYWLLSGWTDLWGYTELSVRSLSMIFGGIAVLFGYKLLEKYVGLKSAVIFGVLAILSPLLIKYSNEARMYTLVTAIGLCATYYFFAANLTNKNRYWVVYTLLVAIGMWTHYFMALVWIGHIFVRYLLVKRGVILGANRRLGYISKKYSLAITGATVLFIPWLPSLIHQVVEIKTNGFWIPAISVDVILSYISNSFAYQNVSEMSPWGAVVFLVTLVVVVAAIVTFRSKNRDKKLAVYVDSLLILFAIPSLLLVLISLPPFGSTFIDRYLLPSWMFLIMLLAIIIAKTVGTKKRKYRYGILLPTLLVAGGISGLTNLYALGNYNKHSETENNTRELVAAIHAQKVDGPTVIITDTPWQFYEAAFYETKDYPVKYFNEGTDFSFGSLAMLRARDEGKIKDIRAIANEYKYVWLLSKVTHDDKRIPAHWIRQKALQIPGDINKEASGYLTLFETRK